VTLTPRQQHALILAIAQGIRPDNPAVAAATIRSLHARGLIHLRTSRKRKALWKATDAGRGLIARTGLEPTFLHRRSQYGYTHRYSQAMAREPEVMR